MTTLLEKTLGKIVPTDESWREKAKQHILTLTMPPWALGRVLDLAVDLAGMRRSLSPETKRKRIVLFAGDHGITAEGVASQPSSVTLEMVRNIVHGGAASSVLAKTFGASVNVIDSGVAGDLSAEVRAGLVTDRKTARGTNDFAKGPAMSRDQAVKCISDGISAALDFSGSTDVFATGEMGIGNTTPSSAIIALYCGAADDPLPFVDRGAGLADSRLAHKAEVIRHGIELNSPDPADPLDVLAKIGGFEIGGIAGLILGAAALRKPVLVDGFISTAGAVLAMKLAPAAADYMICAHGSVERGHAAMLGLLGKKPLLDLSLRLGEGTGAALAMPLLDAAAAILTRMATFESAGVNVKEMK